MEAASQRMKHSQFNYIVPIPDTDDVLVYNFATEALMRLDPVRKKLFEFADQLPADNGLLKKWKQNGFVTDVDEVEAIIEAENKRLDEYCKRTDKVLRLTIHVTSLCNFGCPYCFQSRRSGHMPAEVQDAIVRYTEHKLSTGEYKRMTAVWFGGEPLVASDIIESLGHRLMDIAGRYDAGFSSSLQTNAYLLDQDMVDMLEGVNCRFVTLTLDGYGRYHDASRHLKDGSPTFDHIIHNLRNIKTDMVLNVRSNLDAGNYRSYNELRQLILDIAEETGNEMRCSPSYVHNSEEGLKRGYHANSIKKKDYLEILGTTDLLERSHAYSRRSSFCYIVQPDNYLIDDQGWFFPHCNEYVTDRSRAYCNILDLDEDSYDIPDKKHLEFAKSNFLPHESERCMKCRMLPVCYGGCMITRLVKGHTVCPDEFHDPDGYIMKKYQTLASE